MNVATFTDWINVCLAGGVCVACTSIAARMSRGTRCAVRFGVVAMFVGAMLAAFGGFWEFGEWVQTVTLGGVLIYLVANLRQPLAIPSSRWSDGLAWAITFAIVAVVGLTLSAGS